MKDLKEIGLLVAVILSSCASVKAQNTYYRHFWDDKQVVYHTGDLEVVNCEAAGMYVAMLTTCSDLPYVLEDTVTYGVLVYVDEVDEAAWYGWNLGYHFQYYHSEDYCSASLAAGTDGDEYRFLHLNNLLGYQDTCSCNYADDEEHYMGSDCGCRSGYEFCPCQETYFEMRDFAGSYFPYSTVRIIIYRSLRTGEEQVFPW